MFPQRPVPAATIYLYVEHLTDLPEAQVEAAVATLVCTYEWFPTLRAIREAVAENTLGLPSQDQALVQVERLIEWGRLDEGSRPAAPTLHPAVREALDHVGGFYAFRGADEPTIVRAQFLKLYASIRERQIKAVQVRTIPAPQLGSITAGQLTTGLRPV